MQESRKQCITVQPAKDGPKLSTSKLPLRTVDLEDIGQLSDLVASGFHIESQEGHNILSSNTTLVCP